MIEAEITWTVRHNIQPCARKAGAATSVGGGLLLFFLPRNEVTRRDAKHLPPVLAEVTIIMMALGTEMSHFELIYRSPIISTAAPNTPERRGLR